MSPSPVSSSIPGGTPPLWHGTGPAPLPTGTVLLHIGPPKTGTTALQGAFWNARAALATQGVRYAGGLRQPVKAMMAATGRPLPGHAKPPSMSLWRSVVREATTCREPRSVISSEGFAYATDEAARRVVADMGAERAHVLLTLRPLAAMLASEWQQSVQQGVGLSLDEWLERIFNQPRGWPGKTFWQRQAGELVPRWAAAAGPDRVTILVVDERDRDAHFRALEQLLDLPAGALVPDVDRSNRSLTLEEVEVLRGVRRRFDAAGLAVEDYIGLTSTRAARHLKRRTPGADEHRIEVPEWALERAAEVARAAVEVIRAGGVRVIGDLDHLASRPAEGRTGDQAPVAVPLDVAAEVAMGYVLASGSAGGSRDLDGPWARRRLAEELGLRNLAALVAMAVMARIRGKRRPGG